MAIFWHYKQSLSPIGIYFCLLNPCLWLWAPHMFAASWLEASSEGQWWQMARGLREPGWTWIPIGISPAFFLESLMKIYGKGEKCIMLRGFYEILHFWWFAVMETWVDLNMFAATLTLRRVWLQVAIRKTWFHYSNQHIVHRGWRILIPYADKVDVFTPINILFIEGGEFWSLMKIKLMLLPQSPY